MPPAFSWAAPLIFSESKVFDTRAQSESWGDRLVVKVNTMARQAIESLGYRRRALIGDSQDAKAAATMDDLDTPFLAASSSSRLLCGP